MDASDKKILDEDGWVVECDYPFEIRKSQDGETVGFASGEAADIILDSLKGDATASKAPARVQRSAPTGDLKTGVVRKWLGEKGFGFIVPDDGGDDVFVHQSVIEMDGFRQLEEGQKVEFKEGTGRDGKVAAETARPI